MKILSKKNRQIALLFFLIFFHTFDISANDPPIHAPFGVTGNYLGIYNGTDYTPIFVKGVNLGATVPGSWPGQIAISSEQYARWFRMMTDAGFNTLRIFTVHFPRFYSEFARYNIENPDKPLYLLQGVWLREKNEFSEKPDDLYFQTAIFDQDIKNAIDCIHGNKTIETRRGESYGKYTADVSRWVMGYIIGREIHAYETQHTDNKYPEITVYKGAHLSIENASPTEAWITERLDKLVAYEISNYGVTRPVANSNWSTLDPIDHPGEPSGSGDDDASIDLTKITLDNAPAGIFSSYHSYPYYPNFMNEDEKYKNVMDDEGINNFLGYLRDLRDHYKNMPLLITEFGLPSSVTNAFTSVSGMNQGGLTEEQQGKYTVRMFKNIYDTGCGGGTVFSWTDEWFKTTWITNPMTSDRRNMWHNICSPENNYGLIRFAPSQNYYNNRKTQNIEMAKISKTDTWHDFVTFNFDIALKSRLDTGDTLWIAIDTHDRSRGESTLPNGKRVIKNRAEFLLRITPDSANLYVTKAYNLFGLSLKRSKSEAYQTKTTDGEPWELIRWQNGAQEYLKFPHVDDIGKLSVCLGNDVPKTHQFVHIKDDKISVRLPWMLLNFSDPSNCAVIDDDTPRSQDLCNSSMYCSMQYLKSSYTSGVALTFIFNDRVAELPVYKWNSWNLTAQEILNPLTYIEVEKESLAIIREYLLNSTNTVPVRDK